MFMNFKLGTDTHCHELLEANGRFIFFSSFFGAEFTDVAGSQINSIWSQSLREGYIKAKASTDLPGI